MNEDEWKDWYKDHLREWKEGYKKALKEWRERLRDLKAQTGKTQVISGVPIPHLPPMPPVPFVTHIPGGRSNVVASRIGDEELRLIDLLTEAGLFSTRSEAVAYLVSQGIRARQDIFDKVSSSLEEIRKIRKEAEEQVAKLKRDIGISETGEVGEAEEPTETCPKCSKDLSELPEDITLCPYCGTKLTKDSNDWRTLRKSPFLFVQCPRNWEPEPSR